MLIIYHTLLIYIGRPGLVVINRICRRGIVDVCNILQRRVCDYTRYCGVDDLPCG